MIIGRIDMMKCQRYLIDGECQRDIRCEILRAFTKVLRINDSGLGDTAKRLNTNGHHGLVPAKRQAVEAGG